MKAKFLLLLFTFLLSCNSEKNIQPNVVLIYLDDLGYGDVSSYELGTLETPNMDKIANGGIRFTNGYASSATCSPSRYALMTGTYPWRNKKAKIITGGNLPKELISNDVSIESDNLDSLLVHFISYLVVLFDTDLFISGFAKIEISRGENFLLKGILKGDIYDQSKHGYGVEIKACR